LVDSDNYPTDPSDQMRYQVMRIATQIPKLCIP
jgi:hypothetical protein